MAGKNDKSKAVEAVEAKAVAKEAAISDSYIADIVAKEVAKALSDAKNDECYTDDDKASKRAKIKASINARSKELVEYFIPYVEGEPDEVTVGVNGKIYKIQKGVKVNIPRSVYEVLINSGVQAMEFQKVKKNLENQNLG